jgi:hypothetical protein
MVETPTPKPYDVTYEDRGQYLHARVAGPRDSVAISLQYWNEIALECRSRGHQRMLVVEDFENSVSISDVFEVAAQLPAIIRGMRVAFVDERIGHMEENTFGEDVAVNRGALGRVFVDTGSADAWLRET